MKLLIVIIIGSPEITLKSEILSHNMKYIRKTFTGDITLKLFKYDNYDIKYDFDGITVEEICEPGYIGQFYYKYVTPSVIQDYDHCMLLLDDVRLDTFNMDKVLQIQTKYGYDILSPSFDQKSKTHEYMKSNSKNEIHNTTGIELFCYTFTKESYIRYYNLLNDESAFLWGIDYNLGILDFKCGIMQPMVAEHCISGECYVKKDAPDAFKEMENNDIRFGSTYSTIYYIDSEIIEE